MSKTKNFIIAILFLLIIFVFGAGTLLKCEDDLIKAFSEDNFDDCKTTIESGVQEKFKSKNNWININGLFQRVAGVTIIRDPGGTDVYKLKNGQTVYTLPEQDMEWYAEQVKSLYDHATDADIDFLYVQQPFKVESDAQMPLGVIEYGNENSDELLSMLREKDIPTLDIRKSIKAANYEHSTLFFDTDHHWKPDTALWAAGVIVKDLEERYDLGLKESEIRYYYDLTNYNVSTYKEWFLGSLGKRTGAWYSGVDDFDVITPKFDTDYDFYAKSASGDIIRRGAFDEVMFKWDLIDEKNYFKLNAYAGYLGGDYAITSIENNKSDNDLSVLLIKDSYSNAMVPYLSTQIKSVTAIDLRHYNDMSMFDYINANDFDVVIIAYNPSAFTEAQFGF